MEPKDVVTSKSQIPYAPFYVCVTDSFMSGWGPAAGLTNRLIFACETEEQADIVYANCQARSDFKRARISRKRPTPRPNQLCQLKTQEIMPCFYQPGAFD